MISPLLERAIMNGRATYSKYTHALGAYGKLVIPDDQTIIIVDITWHNFFNPYKNDGAVTFAEFFKYNEYQLKIDGLKSINYLTYRNGFELETTNPNPFNPNAARMDAYLPGLGVLRAKPPVFKDVYFICQKYIRISISRNVFFNSFAGSSYGLLSQKAAQQVAPNGLQDTNVLRRATMLSATPQTMYYTPEGDEEAGLASPGGRNRQNYFQDQDRDLSQIYPPNTGYTATLNNPTFTQPLVEFGIVTINSNEFSKLGNS